MFSRLADETAVPFRLVVCHASLETLQQRLLDRAEAGVDVSDADVSVLAQQMRAQEPLSEAEQRASLRMDTDDCDKATLLLRLAGFIAP